MVEWGKWSGSVSISDNSGKTIGNIVYPKAFSTRYVANICQTVACGGGCYPDNMSKSGFTLMARNYYNSSNITFKQAFYIAIGY